MNVQSLQIFAENLIEKGFVFETRAVKVSKSGREQIVEVGDTSALSTITPIQENSISHYLELIRQDKFSWLLFDASLVQIWYRRRADQVTAHRYCYIPAPFQIDLRLDPLLNELDELLEGNSVRDPLNTSRRTSLRFECSPEEQTADHPAAHLHLNTPSCRIPMRSAFSAREFMYFIIRFFYSTSFEAHSLASPNFFASNTLTNAEERAFHLNWRAG